MVLTDGIKIVPAYKHPEEIRALFSEYTDMLIANDKTFQEYLAILHYDDEIRHLEEKYGYPWGRLYLAYCGTEAAGCIGLKKIDDQNCEMKRLYVRPQSRGQKLGEQLAAKIINDAREIGYSHMLIDCYNDSPMSTSIYMRLDL